MTDILNGLLSMPDLNLEPLPTLADLGMGWDSNPLAPTTVLDIPDADSITLDDLAERYRPAEAVVTPRGKGRRPPLWNDPRVLALLGYLEIGAGRGQATIAAGLAERTVMRWLEIGRDEAERAESEHMPLTFYRHFRQALMRAEMVPVIRALDTIRRAGQRGGWRAAAWFLERRYPDSWGPKATAWKRDVEQRGVSEPSWNALFPASGEDLEAKVLRILGQRGAGLSLTWGDGPGDA